MRTSWLSGLRSPPFGKTLPVTGYTMSGRPWRTRSDIERSDVHPGDWAGVQHRMVNHGSAVGKAAGAFWGS